MCLIIDANVGDELIEPPSCSAAVVMKWAHCRKNCLVLLGKLRRELFKITALRGWLTKQLRNGMLIYVYDTPVENSEASIISGKSCISDDHHVIALAQVSKVRILYSRDQALHHDFKNAAFLPPSGGAVYSDPDHRHLL